MSGETEKEISGWTVDTYRVHNEAMRAGDEKFQTERDRRYSEVAIEREKALRIKEVADAQALDLARQIQAYKDEKANELRAQIESERGIYLRRDEFTREHRALVEKMDTAIKPLAEYVTSQSGPRAITGTTLAAFLAAVALLVGIYLGLRDSGPAAPSSTVTVTTTR